MQAVRPSKQRLKQSAKVAGDATSIQLRGSTKIVTEFFEYGLSSILYQRNLYPPDDFKMVKKYGLNMLIPSDDGLRSYLTQITGQLAGPSVTGSRTKAWLNSKQVSRLVLAIMDKDSRETIERWQFDITLEDGFVASAQPADGKENAAPTATAPSTTPAAKPPPSEQDIRAQIQALFKTICSSTAVLPILSDNCTFNVLAYTSLAGKDDLVPAAWSDTDAHFVVPKHPTVNGDGVEHIRLRSFGTGVHKVDGSVAYRVDDSA